MHSESTVNVESHPSAATLYVTGELTTIGVMHALAEAEQLPDTVRALCIDLRAVRSADSHAMRVLEIGLRDWRSKRRGMSRVKLADGADTRVVSLRFPHRRWTPRPRSRSLSLRNPGGIRMRDHRRAVVTRSLRERADSETP